LFSGNAHRSWFTSFSTSAHDKFLQTLECLGMLAFRYSI
jgi:hypothetical protein